MKARKVKGLEAQAPLADAAERLVRVRLDELFSFMPQAADPAEVEALHDLRIAAKRVRYVLEVTGPLFGPYAQEALAVTKDLQDLVGEIHDCDVHLPEVRDVLADVVREDADALVEQGDPEAHGGAAPGRDAYAGLVGVLVAQRARRELLFAQFLERWRDLERAGFRARLEYALTERQHAGGTPG